MPVSSTLAERPQEPLILQVREVLAEEPKLPLPVQARRDDLLAYYGDDSSMPLWIGTGNMAKLLDRLGRASLDGLNPESYPLEFLEDLSDEARTAPAPRLAEIELWYTAHFLRYAEDLKTGRVVPRMVHPDAYMPRKAIIGVNVLTALQQLGDVSVFFNAWEPYNPTYRRLREHLAAFQDMAVTGGFVQLPPGRDVETGETDSRIPLLRRRLAAEGLIGSTTGDAVLDDGLVTALRKAQHRYGLAETGKLDAATVIALNIPIERRIEQIELAMERQRWLPELIQGITLLIDKEQGKLQLIENGRLRKTLEVFPNCPDRLGVIRAAALKEIALNPAWNVPAGYLGETLLPLLKKDPAALAKQGFRLSWKGAEVPLASLPWKDISEREISIRQDDIRLSLAPGPANPLGTFLIRFEGTSDMFIHALAEAPQDGSRCDMALPSTAFGIVGGLDFVAELIDPRLLPVTGLKELIARGSAVTFPARQNAMAIALFQSAWIDERGDIRFGHDVNGEDRRLRQALVGRFTG
ncbi:peptidoglycan-binding protein [Stappia sp. F7233]|uniref:Peptidoglycan-binding protein n=1 Tax=Stappia albiluteola TaxID=2758565 RepID=A0A839A9D9_9HYPH|nr:peptidoglycan-binding protein [Stappia albiluteola]MBA5775816.1 peptidoglycan-binding protein [Stappia albiluteola]